MSWYAKIGKGKGQGGKLSERRQRTLSTVFLLI